MNVRVPAATLWAALTLFVAGAASADGAGEALASELKSRSEVAPGAAGAVLTASSGLVTAQSGVADKVSGAPVSDETRFLSGSIGKTITAAVAARLFNDGVISLNDPIGKYLSDRPWYGKLRNKDVITVGMLLNHSAGVPSYLDDLGFYFSQRGHRLNGYSPDDLIAFVARKKPVGPPGKHFSYSDTHYIMMGMIIEQASGKRFYDLACEIVLGPMNLADTAPLVGTAHDRLANAYEKSGLMQLAAGVAGPAIKNGKLKFTPDYEWTGGGFVTTPADLASFYRQLFSSDDFADIRATMTAPENANPVSDGLDYGLGVYINKRQVSDTIYAHGGDFMGYRSFVLYSEKNETAIAIQANAKAYEPGDTAFAILDRLTSGQ